MTDLLKKMLSILSAFMNHFKPKPVDPDDPVVVVVEPDPVVIVPTPLPPTPIPVPPNPIPDPIPVPAPVNNIIPGDNVTWITLKAFRNDSNPAWKSFLTDVHNHLPKELGNQYYGGDLVTHCHETTHGINNYVSNTYKDGKSYGFYVGNDKACIVKQPNVTIAQVAALIPKNLRGTRYQLYLINQQRDWQTYPMYLHDEFSAYLNAAITGLQVADSFDNVNDYMVGPLEFAIYVLFLTIAVQKYDPEFLSNVQYKEFLAHELRRGLQTYKKGIKIPVYKWDTNLETEMRNSTEIKDILHVLYGDALTLDMLLKEE